MSGSNPWETIGSRIVWKGKHVSIQEDDVVTPRGTQGKYELLIAKNGCMVIPVSPEGELYFVGLWRYPTGRYSIEFPGGAGDAGETIAEAGKRELFEETGLVSSKWTSLGLVDAYSSRTSSVNEVFLAEKVEETEPHDIMEMIDEGINKVMRLSFNEVSGLVHSGKITHSLTIAALFLYMSHIGHLKQV
jgi:8-oxo-dGTP pyrophosphatase MutT (NUDIX family)